MGKGRFMKGAFRGPARFSLSHRATLPVLEVSESVQNTRRSALRLTPFMESTYRSKHHQKPTECSRQCGPFALYMPAMHNAGTQNRPLLRKQD